MTTSQHFDTLRSPIETGPNAEQHTELTRLEWIGGTHLQPRFNLLLGAGLLFMPIAKSIDGTVFKASDRLKFWKNVKRGEPDECWLWQAGVFKSGYGAFAVRQIGRVIATHRVSYAITYGYCPASHVLHSCDTPACVNPKHLYTGDHNQNLRDAMVRHRVKIGQSHGMAILSDAQVLEIRRLYAEANGAKGIQVRLAKQFNMSSTGIFVIVHNRYWKHLL